MTVDIIGTEHQFVQISVDMLTNARATHNEMQNVFEAAVNSLAIGNFTIARSVVVVK